MNIFKVPDKSEDLISNGTNFIVHDLENRRLGYQGQFIPITHRTFKFEPHMCKISQSEPVNTNDFGARSTRLQF